MTVRLHPAVAATRSAVRGALAGLAPGELVLAAVSGGADSLALAAAAAFEAPRAGLRAGVVTVDHGLQWGSAERAQRVAAWARTAGLAPVDVATVSVGDAGGPEAAARSARYAALDEVAERRGAVAILLGHTLDDQAETVLLGLARGSGARSLAGMAPVQGTYRRPFLDLRRETARTACTVQEIPVWDDPHNTDLSFTRPRVRHDVLPVLTAALGPGVPEALARTARQLRADADALDAWAQDAASRDCTHLAGLPDAVRTRVLHRTLLAAGCPAGSLAAAHVDAVDALVTRWRGQGPVHLPGGLAVSRRGGWLVCEAACR